MPCYRVNLTELYGSDVGSVVGCGLDRLHWRGLTHFSKEEIEISVSYYRKHRQAIDQLTIGDRRECIADHMEKCMRAQRAVQEWPKSASPGVRLPILAELLDQLKNLFR